MFTRSYFYRVVDMSAHNRARSLSGVIAVKSLLPVPRRVFDEVLTVACERLGITPEKADVQIIVRV